MSDFEAQLELDRGSFKLSVEVSADGGGITSIVGPSGAGKTTLLRCVAGLEPRVTGRIVVAGETWLDGRRSMPTHRRRIGYVFQEASLFAHLDVRRNLAFGYERVPRGERRTDYDDVVAWLELAPLLARRVDGLSGGERQRVALGRALLASPRLLLIDEPLSALDAAARERILPWLEALPDHLGAPVLHVSHSMREVARLARRIVWLENGRVRASGAAHDVLPVYGAGDDELAAVLEGEVLEHHDEDALTEVVAAGQRLLVRRIAASPGTRVRLLVLARDVSIAMERDRGSSILNELEAVVERIHTTSAGAVVTLALGERCSLLARITRRSLRLLELTEGRHVFARVKGVGVEGPSVEPQRS